MERKILYHCTNDYKGPLWKTGLEIPKAVRMGWTSEPSVPRLCASPTIAGCFASQLFLENKQVYLYATQSKFRGVKPFNVHDMLITGERWLVHKPEMKLEKAFSIEDAIDDADMSDMFPVNRKQFCIRNFR